MTCGATAWASASDQRLKDILGYYENSLEDIKQINAIKYKWKKDVNHKLCGGVSAQSAQNIVPEAIDTIINDGDNTDYLGVIYIYIYRINTFANCICSGAN